MTTVTVRLPGAVVAALEAEARGDAALEVRRRGNACAGPPDRPRSPCPRPEPTSSVRSMRFARPIAIGETTEFFTEHGARAYGVLLDGGFLIGLCWSRRDRHHRSARPNGRVWPRPGRRAKRFSRKPSTCLGDRGRPGLATLLSPRRRHLHFRPRGRTGPGVESDPAVLGRPDESRRRLPRTDERNRGRSRHPCHRRGFSRLSPPQPSRGPRPGEDVRVRVSRPRCAGQARPRHPGSRRRRPCGRSGTPGTPRDSRARRARRGPPAPAQGG